MIRTIHTLIEEIPNDVGLMEKALNEKDWEKLRSVAHRTMPNFMLVAREELKKDILAIEEYARERVNLYQLPKLLKKTKRSIPSLIEGLKKEAKKLKVNVE